MWRDRISGQSTPTNSRNLSPLPRRSSSQLLPGPYGRPGVTSKTSSTSLLVTPSDSTASLPGTARTANGSPLKQTSIQRPRPANVPDPLEVLNSIIGKENQTETNGSQLLELEKPAQLVEIIQFDGLSLEDFLTKEEPPR